MACPTCGKPSPCVHEQNTYAQAAGAETREYPSSSLSLSVADGEILDQADEKFWRQEVISRVQQHRARRRKRFDAQATLELDFQDGIGSSAPVQQEKQRATRRPLARQEPPKIIEFPRPAAAQPLYHPPKRYQEPEELELAEPMIEAPRILDAPEPSPQQMDLLPAFADIQLEAEADRQAGQVELPLQPAPLGYRLFAGLVDLMVVLMAAAVFLIGVLAFTEKLPPSRMSMLCGLVLSAGLWLIYQYLFLVHSKGTPGMQLAQLELCTFQGESVPRSLRCQRALASLLSALAMGLGFAWALVDEDTLGWHDRITQTHLKHSAHSTQHSVKETLS